MNPITNGVELKPNKALEKHLKRITRKHQLKIEKLTEEQFIQVLKQAIASGDFIKIVSQDGSKQGMSYVPFRLEQQLRAEIVRLKAELAAKLN